MRPLSRDQLRVVEGGAASRDLPVTDERIIDAFARKDRRAAELVYDRLHGVVDATLYRVLGKRDVDHDDLVQATFEQIIVTLARRSFAGGCSLAGWASSIACHVALNSIRSRTRARRVFTTTPDEEASEHRASGEDVEAQIIARVELDRVRSHLAAMDPGRAETVMLVDVFDLSLAETARLTNVSLSAAQSRLVRGRRDLLARFKEEDR